MRICVFGAGAVGGLVAARIARLGQEVNVVARGARKAAIERDGLRVEDRDGLWSVRPARVGEARELGPQDIVIVVTKAHALPDAVEDLEYLVHDQTVVVTAVNGIPWWYFAGRAPHELSLATVDPGGRLWSVLDPRRAVGCLIHLGASSPEPGLIKHAYGNLLVVGEPDGSVSPRLEQLTGLLQRAAFKPRVSGEIHDEVWRKLWYNIAINPVSVVTGADCGRICADPLLRQLLADMMRESAEVAAWHGVKATLDVDEQIDGIARIGAFKTSMLQDLEAGRSIELDPVLGSVVEMAKRVSIPVPRLQEVYSLARVRAAAMGCYTPLAEQNDTSQKTRMAR